MNKTKRTRAARKTRSQIARTFDALSDDQLNYSDVLKNSPAMSHMHRVRVFNVIRRLPHMGDDGAEKVLLKAKVWPLKRMRELTEDDRAAIIAALPPRAKNQV